MTLTSTLFEAPLGGPASLVRRGFPSVATTVQEA